MAAVREREYDVHMTRVVAIALCLIGLTGHLCAQRGMSHGGGAGSVHGAVSRGGSSGPAMSGFHGGGGFSASAPARFTAVPRYGRYAGNVPRGVSSGAGIRNSGYYGGRPYYGGYAGNHSGNHSPGNGGHRPPYRSPYGTGSRYVTWYGPGTGWVYPYYPYYPYYSGYLSPGYWGDSGYGDSTAYPNYLAQDGSQDYPGQGYGQGYEQQPQEQEPPRPSYQAAPAEVHPSTAPEITETVTLVFKDGRPREQIHNYILSRTMLSVLDEHHRDIPVDQLDLAATRAANRAAGVEFSLPGSSR